VKEGADHAKDLNTVESSETEQC